MEIKTEILDDWAENLQYDNVFDCEDIDLEVLKTLVRNWLENYIELLTADITYHVQKKPLGIDDAIAVEIEKLVEDRHAA
ncbi:MAG TPA: hypothetical protein IGS17_00535 [Oscillatoriales cyanobacterium M59_W2019_021]|nr:MAG: hypothetical protein D6728_07495 [Cyanobacteria bacterium J055]HIK29888.1 hypothetical protein [Oscillatoriales cyanobacterium M4454_W2019_049]HIK49403.1 hypothetical protein [Oscillatoriales cyanobacterium M59_W2019_021]